MCDSNKTGFLVKACRFLLSLSAKKNAKCMFVIQPLAAVICCCFSSVFAFFKVVCNFRQQICQIWEKRVFVSMLTTSNSSEWMSLCTHTYICYVGGGGGGGLNHVQSLNCKRAHN